MVGVQKPKMDSKLLSIINNDLSANFDKSKFMTVFKGAPYSFTHNLTNERNKAGDVINQNKPFDVVASRHTYVCSIKVIAQSVG